MNLTLALLAGLAAAAAYGTGSAVQHAAAHVPADAGAPAGTAGVDVAAVGGLFADRRWLLGSAADVAGLVLQVVSLALGPVSLLQPLQVLALLVALPVGARLAGTTVPRRSWLAAAGLVVAVGVFLGLLGDPGEGRPPGTGAVVVLTVVVAGGGLALVGAVVRARRPVRALVFGLVSGVLFAGASVLMRVVTLRVAGEGYAVFTRPRGWVPLVAVVLLGALGLGLTQAGFQLGALAASLPAQTAADPLAAVVLGSALLGERLPLSGGLVVVDVVALAVVALAARALAAADPAGGR